MAADSKSRSGSGRRPLLIAGAATIAIAIAIGGVWWGGFRPGVRSDTQSPHFAGAGKIDSLEGKVRITSRSGERAAQAGLDVYEGDTIRTGANAWALIEMTDGATITVRPGTEARIETYHYAPDGAASENRSAIALVKGALRVITGAIGQINRRGYSISTPTATIGIRGTDHEPSYYPPGDAELAGQPPGTYDKVNYGETVIRNPRGEVAVRPGRSAFVPHDARTAPRLLAREPAFYQRHAGIDRRAAARRTEIHHRVERERQLRKKPPAAKSEKKAQKEHPKEQAKQSDDKKGAKDQPKGAQSKIAQERDKEQEKQRADKKDGKDQPRAGAQAKTPQELRQERLKEQEKQRADKKGGKDQPKAGAQPKTPQELRKERLEEMERRREQ